EKEKRARAKQGQEVEPDAAAVAAAKALEEKAARNREINRKREEERVRKEQQAQLRDMVISHSIACDGGDVAYNFPHDRTVKTIHVTREIQLRLGRGQVGIVWMDEAYHLVPRETALKVEERDEDALLVLYDAKDDEPDEDDPYAEYQVPDDLVW
ncbi:MAG: DUF2058 domain-containing protein, partial [bacterium]|nr:DUF2058 domain-containing protein [bacterium]